MKHISTVIIGAGQAGLAMSKHLSDRSVAHVVIERGEIANAWINERWDSLRLLTPNWQSRLPGYSYSGDNPDGFMTMPQVTAYLRGYAEHCMAPIEDRTAVTSVSLQGFGYRVDTTKGAWTCDNVVLATGACARAHIPKLADSLPSSVTSLTPMTYKTAAQLDPGGVLVVGASASGMQLAAELRRAGHDVTLSVGAHIRVPRNYRGRDIQWWMDRSGVLETRVDEVDDIDRARRVPSLQLTGDRSFAALDLNTLEALGVEMVGRLAGIRDGFAQFSGSLANQCALSDLKMNRLLDGFDIWAEQQSLSGLGAAERLEPTRVATEPSLELSLRDGRIRTIIWATGYRPDFRWLNLPVFNAKGQLNHSLGVVAPGLYVLGLPFLQRRGSALMDGIGADAEVLSNHLVLNRAHRAA
ncbi:NAD(P)-binding domain-containing protein [Tropicimonas sp. TH_r6]|uniref:NAD(P)-binding domain-containing protein n=1 Tax=Tropicimonas sp. TH_r6 TaxID=3082085 RepID=UPI002952F572|nr:NAD(P)-binding domain-containing protein [Tropicimonas sp. TH_r6]MDV7145737.1 NAD(P)-binding domain-containing protein [Tropicimonas sp. TH_r6]